MCSCYGSQEGIGHVGLALCDEGDTVLLPTPCYPVFMAGMLMAGADPWYYPLTKENAPEGVLKKMGRMVTGVDVEAFDQHPEFDGAMVILT